MHHDMNIHHNLQRWMIKLRNQNVFKWKMIQPWEHHTYIDMHPCAKVYIMLIAIYKYGKLIVATISTKTKRVFFVSRNAICARNIWLLSNDRNLLVTYRNDTTRRLCLFKTALFSPILRKLYVNSSFSKDP